MDSQWVSVEARHTESLPSPPSRGSAPAPRYTRITLVGLPPRPHFHMIDEPDATTSASNSNGWVILRDEELDGKGLWSRPIMVRWAETTTMISTPTQINGAIYGSDQVELLRQLQDYNDDDRTGYFFDDHDDSKDLQHYHCDINTITGELLPPLKHPRTLPAPLHQFDISEPDRKDRTSEDVIMQKLSRLGKAKASKKSTPQKAYQDAILAVEEDLRRKPMKPTVGHLYSVPEALIFRPAVARDIEAITSIYNAEVTGAGMAPDSGAVAANNFQQIFQACQVNKKPFIVAVKNANRLADVSNWPDRMAFEDWKRLKKTQGEPVENEEVLGFAFLCPFDYGIWGSEGNAQYSARVRCFVSPKQRRQGIGRALVDLMLQMTVTGYAARCDTEWKHKRPSQVFNRTAFKNTKKYHRIFIEVYFKNKGDSAFEGLQTLLENQLGFTPMGHILGGYMTERGEESTWLDKHIWGMDAAHQDEVGWYRKDVRDKRTS